LKDGTGDIAGFVAGDLEFYVRGVIEAGRVGRAADEGGRKRAIVVVGVDFGAGRVAVADAGIVGGGEEDVLLNGTFGSGY
jgi:hypothetical protein